MIRQSRGSELANTVRQSGIKDNLIGQIAVNRRPTGEVLPELTGNILSNCFRAPPGGAGSVGTQRRPFTVFRHQEESGSRLRRSMIFENPKFREVSSPFEIL